jgi:hypothetical protein
MSFSKNKIGYIEDTIYTLVVEDLNNDSEIMCVTKLPKVALDKIIRELKANIEL